MLHKILIDKIRLQLHIVVGHLYNHRNIFIVKIEIIKKIIKKTNKVLCFYNDMLLKNLVKKQKKNCFQIYNKLNVYGKFYDFAIGWKRKHQGKNCNAWHQLS